MPGRAFVSLCLCGGFFFVTCVLLPSSDKTTAMKVSPCLLLAVLCAAVATSAQSSLDPEMLAKIRTEGMEHSQVAAVFDYLTINIARG
jgi:hypothetical protein